MAIPTPREIVMRYGRRSPEELARALDIRVARAETASAAPAVTVLSEYRPDAGIILYLPALCRAAERRHEPPERLEQWHIAHELYHALAEAVGVSTWRVRETAANAWADELLALIAPEE